jgi:chromosomal replication initiation ATPase DnaA
MKDEQLEKIGRDFGWDLIVFAVAKHCGVQAGEIVSRSRISRVTLARHITSYLYRELTALSYPAIGAIIGRDHSTVISSHTLIARRVAASPIFGRELSKLRASILAQPEAKHSTVLKLQEAA